MSLEYYRELLRTFGIPTVSVGYATVHIYKVEELTEGQIGYSVTPSGASLIDDSPGTWKKNWIVIGYEDECGDPIFIDASTPSFAVYTAKHGAGSWEPRLRATELRNFEAAMRELATLAKGRENPVRLEQNPITPDERTDVLERIQRDNPNIDETFWHDLLGSN